jgi:hypothetical protein
LKSSSTPEDAERQLIDYYMDSDDPHFLVRPLRAFPALRKRMHLIQRAKDDYFAGRYYACVLVLLTVMDGFVNEFEAVRQGLHAREAEELDAFDSVVGHHMGLTNAHKTFRKSKGTTDEEPVYDLFRNGILHGILLNYDNEVVATKAWNRLFAVVDWAKAREKEQLPRKPDPTWKELLAQLAENARQQKMLEAWRPETLTSADDGFRTHPAYQACARFLSYWVQRNYGGIATLVMKQTRDAYGSSMPRHINFEYSRYHLSQFAIRRLEHSAAAICTIEVVLVFETGDEKPASLRWAYENEKGDSVVPPQAGEWHIVLWSPVAFLRQA